MDVEISMKNSTSRVRVTLNPAGEDGYQSQVAKYFKNYVKPLPKHIEFSHFVLTDGAGTLILGCPKIRLEEKLFFRLPSNIQPESASNWTAQYLSLLGIEFEDFGLDVISFLDGFPMPVDISREECELQNELKLLTPELLHDFVTNSNVNNDNFKILENNIVIKSACMLAKYGSNEAAVDIFIVFLLQKIGFYSNRLFAFPQMRHTITFGDVKKEAIPDFTIIDVLSYFRIAVIEDKSEDSNDPESKTEAQLVAEAIAIFQANQRMRNNIVVRETEGKQATKRSKHDEKRADAENGTFLDEIVLGVRVKGMKFTFYVIPISVQIQTAIHTKTATITGTIVKRCGPFDFQFKNAQHSVIQVLQAYHRIITTVGEKSVRRNSDTKKSTLH